MEVSVIIPVYNRKQMLDNALKSLQIQDFNSFEIIVVDDGSTDNCEELQYKYKNLNFKYIKIKRSGNLAYVRNKGVKEAKGKFIAVLDSDDICCPTRLKDQYKYMTDNKDIDILASWVEIKGNTKYNSATRLEKLYNIQGDKDELIYYFLTEGCCICHSSVMMKSNVLRQLNGYSEAMPICEDYDLWVRAISQNKKISILPKKLVVRMLHNDSVTSEFEGSSLAIKNVISIKLSFLCESMHLILNSVIIWGNCTRNDLVIPMLKNTNPNICIKTIDVYNELPIDIDADYSFITTFNKKDSVFLHLKSIGKTFIKDFIYL